MKNRISENQGRVLITPENGSAPFYATMTRADNPTQEGDPLDKNTLLKDATAALFGLGADAVPDDVLSMLYRVTNYAWKRRPAEYIEKRTSVPSGNFYLAYGSNSSACRRTIEYSEEIEINSTTGEVSLRNPQTVTVTYSDYSTEVALLKGKYIKNTYSFDNDILFISDSATFGRGNYYINFQNVQGNVFFISSEKTEDWSIVYAPGRSTYPDNGISNGYEYVFLGNPLDNAISAGKTETGSYAGAGAAGSSNPNKLTFQSPPKFVVVQDASDSPSVRMIFLINGVKRVFPTTVTNPYYALYVTWNGNEVSWYDDNNDKDSQMNQSGHTYNYIMIP